MTLFRVFLATCLIVILGYTSVTIANHGANLFPIFFGDMAKMAWPGQFNLDFMTLLGLSGTWVAWRHRFTPGAIALGIVAFFGGMMFLAPYLLWASAEAGGDPELMLLGRRRARR